MMQQGCHPPLAQAADGMSTNLQAPEACGSLLH